MNIDLIAFILVIICLKKKDETNVINLDDYANAGTHWIALYILDKDAIYFDSFRVEHASKKTRHFSGIKNM